MIDVGAPPARLERIEVAPRDATESTLIEDPLEGMSTDARPNRTVGPPLLIEVPRDAQLASGPSRTPVARLCCQRALKCTASAVPSMPGVTTPRKDVRKDENGAVSRSRDAYSRSAMFPSASRMRADLAPRPGRTRSRFHVAIFIALKMTMHAELLLE